MGALREVLTAQYARLAQLLEDAIARLVQDTEVLFAIHSNVLLRRYHVGRMRGCMLKPKVGRHPPARADTTWHSCSSMLMLKQPWALRRV